MSALIRVTMLPFRLAWSLLRLLFWPAVLTALAWLVFGLRSPWFVGVCVAMGLYLLVVLPLWRLGVRGELRSIARGTVMVSRSRSRSCRRADRGMPR